MIKRNLPLILLFVLLAAWAVFLEKTADAVVFGFPREEYSLQHPFREVFFPAADGSLLTALYSPAREGKPTFLIFHGNKQNIYTFQSYLHSYLQDGYGMLVFDYRGYGKSGGKPSEINMYEDAQSALNFLMEDTLISPQEIILWGFSLGSSPALYLASNHADWKFKGVILQSPFTNTTDMAFYLLARTERNKILGPIISLVLRPLLWDKGFDATQFISKVQAPLLIGGSNKDRIVPAALTNALAAKAPLHTHTFISDSGDHDNPFWFRPAVLAFLRSL